MSDVDFSTAMTSDVADQLTRWNLRGLSGHRGFLMMQKEKPESD